MTPYEARYSHGLPKANDAKATVGMILGILSLVTFCVGGAILGVPAIVLGALAKRSIAKSAGTLGGGGSATAAIVTGAIGTLAFVMMTVIWLVPFTTRSRSASAPATVAIGPTASPTPMLAPGWVETTDLHPWDGALRAQLEHLTERATSNGGKLLVETVAAGNEACAEMARAMSDPRVKTALSDTLVARVDVNDFRAELETLKMYDANVPVFYTLDATYAPRARLSADEWDENTPENIAPALRAFLAGSFTSKKKPPAPPPPTRRPRPTPTPKGTVL